MPPSARPGQLAKRLDPQLLRQQASQQLRTMLSQFDLAEIQAQLYAADMVDLLAMMAMDTDLPQGSLPVAEFRAKMALHVLDRAYGKPAEKQYVKVEDNRAGEDKTVTIEIESVRKAVDEYRQMDRYFHLPPDQWPEWLQKRVGGTAAPALSSDATSDQASKDPSAV